MEVVVATILELPLVKVVEVLVDREAVKEEVVLDAGNDVAAVCVLAGEGSMGRAYVRRVGVVVDVSLGGAGTKR